MWFPQDLGSLNSTSSLLRDDPGNLIFCIVQLLTGSWYPCYGLLFRARYFDLFEMLGSRNSALILASAKLILAAMLLTPSA